MLLVKLPRVVLLLAKLPRVVLLLGRLLKVVLLLRIGYTLARKINSEAAWVYRTNLVRWVRYKAGNPIEFGRSKEFIGGFDLV